MLAGYSFSKPPEVIPAPEETVEKAPPVRASADTVVLQKIIVTDHNSYWDLAADIKKARALHAQSQSKLGTGVHEKDFGKIRAYSLTVLYIPVQVGLSW